MRRVRAPRMRAIGARLCAMSAISVATTAAFAEPARAQWRMDTDLGLPVAVSGPVGPIEWIAFFCQPGEGLFLTARFSERVPDAVPVVFTFRYVRYVVPFRRVVPDTTILYADLAAVGDLRAALGGRASSVEVGLDDRPLGRLSLRGSTAAIRDATDGCEPGTPPSPLVVSALEAAADAIDPDAAAVRAALAARDAANGAGERADRDPAALSPSSVAQAPGAAVDVDKKETLPPAVQAAVDEIRAMCDAPGAATRFEPGGLMRVDMNADGVPDYMISALEITCPQYTLMLCGARACRVQVFASLPSGGYESVDVLLGDVRSFDETGLSASCPDPSREFRIAWADGGLRTTDCR